MSSMLGLFSSAGNTGTG